MADLSGLTTNYFATPKEGFTTTLASTISSGAVTVPLNSISGYTNGAIATFAIDPTDASKKQVFTGVVDTSGVQITSVKWTEGTNQSHTTGATVVDYVTATHMAALVKGLTTSIADQDGTLKTNAVDVAAVIADGIITPAKLTTTLQGGWEAGLLPAVSSVTANGNRSYDVVFASTVASYLTPGMRLRTTRTVAAPTQCADLELSSSQYFSKTSPTGVSFTTTFTCMAWVKLESYAVGGIIARRNADTEGWDMEVTADGRLSIVALRIAGNNAVATTYQSLPLNKWVHVAATLDLSGVTATTYFDGVSVPNGGVSVTGTCTTLVQGTTALVVGAAKSAGTSPFDGKIAQAAVFSSVLSASTIRSYMSQTLSGSESTNVSAFSLNGVLTDLNANANTLTASGGAAATNADSPFSIDANGTPGGSYDYAIVTKVATTTATVQVPEGCTIPTTGGVSAVDLSSVKAPFGMPVARGKWVVSTLLLTTLITTSNATYGSFWSGGVTISVPIGEWRLSQQSGAYYNITTTKVTFALSPTALTGLSVTAGALLTKNIVQVFSSAAAAYTAAGNIATDHSLTAQTSFVMYSIGATVSAGIDASNAPLELIAELALL